MPWEKKRLPKHSGDSQNAINKSKEPPGSCFKIQVIFLLVGAVGITVVFYFILAYFNTANMVLSTVSVTTSFIAVYLTFRRSPLFALAYATNDTVLIVLWILASAHDIHYISVVVCFVAFLVNDIYGYISWQKMKVRQQGNP